MCSASGMYTNGAPTFQPIFHLIRNLRTDCVSDQGSHVETAQTLKYGMLNELLNSLYHETNKIPLLRTPHSCSSMHHQMHSYHDHPDIRSSCHIMHLR